MRRCAPVLLLALLLPGCTTMYTRSLGDMPAGYVVTGNPADHEFWTFEARAHNYLMWGLIPIGRIPVDYAVKGNRDECETARAHIVTRTLWRVDRDVPTEPCTGPFYYQEPQ